MVSQQRSFPAVIDIRAHHHARDKSQKALSYYTMVEELGVYAEQYLYQSHHYLNTRGTSSHIY